MAAQKSIAIVDAKEDHPPMPAKYSYFETVQPSRTMHFHLDDSIDDPKDYGEMIHKIMTAGPFDTVIIHLNTPGGRLDTTVAIINAMRCSQAKIITSIEAKAHSAGTMIFLSADEFIVNENCMMMFHNFSGGMWGKGNEMKAQVDATIEWFNSLARDIYYPFFTHEEIDKLIEGADIWLQSNEIRDRLTAMVKVIEKDQKQKESAGQKKPAVKKKTARKKPAS